MSLLCATAAAQQAITFSAIGDVPYSDDELPTLQQHVTNHNRYSPSEFLVHVGDIFSGSTPCDEYRYSQVADVLKQLAVPAWMCPGDNETTDCADKATGWLYWARYFQNLEHNFCGTPAHEHQTVRPENFAFVSKGVLFIGLNLVGGSVDNSVQQDDADWVVSQLQAKVSQVRAAVIFAQAGPNGRDLFFSQFVPAATAFAKPILFLHGDGHSWKDDYPFPTALNVRRIQVERGTKPPIQVTATLDALNPFTIVRDPWPSGTPVYNAPPCVDAGPDLAVSVYDQAWLRGMATDDGDPSGTLAITWSKLSGPGTVIFTSPSTAVTYASFSTTGSYTLRLRASDGALASTNDVNVTVTSGPPTNELPVAVNDAYQVFVGSTLTVSAPGVVGNDYDPDGDRLTAVLATNVAHGTLALNSSGGFTYTPTPDWYGIDAFTYRASDGAFQSNTATVTISVRPLVLTLGPTEDAPVNSTNQTSSYGAARDLRVEQDATTYYSFLKFQVTGTGTRVYRARLRLLVTDSGPDGGRVYAVSNHYAGTSTPWIEEALTWRNAPVIAGTPLASAAAVFVDDWVEFDVTSRIVGDGTYSFGMRNASTNQVEYSSKEGDDPPQLVIETRPGGGGANAAPIAVANAYSVNEDAVLSVPAPGVLGNDTDANGDALTAIFATAPSRGTAALAANGSFTYTPGANFNGTDTFTYIADDGRGGTATGTVTITVQPVNDAPVASDDAYTTNEDVPLVRAAPGVLGNDTDVDGDALAAAVATVPAHGTVALAANGSFTYTPALDYNGVDSFTYTASDGAGGSDTGLVTVTIAAVEDPPRPGADAYTVPEDGRLQVAAPGVLANDVDPEGDPLTVTLATGPAHGSVTLIADGSFIYAPVPDFNGTDSFTYTVSDTHLGTNLGTVTITVTPVNDAPVAAGESYATDEDTPLVMPAPGVLANDTDIDGDVLTAAVAVGPTHGALTLAANGTFTYAPARDFNGTDSFTYTVSDGNGGTDTATATLTVRPVNDPPVAGNDAYTTSEDMVLAIGSPGILANDADVDGDVVTSAPASMPASGTLTLGPDGAFTYRPDPDFNGTDSFTYTALDGRGGSATGTVTITVTPVNDAPVARGETWVTDEDVPLVIAAPGVLANDTDVDGDELTATLVTGPAHGILALAAAGSFTYAPAANYYGGDSFTYRIEDGHGGAATATATITVRSVNDAPAVAADGYTTAEDEPLSVGAPGVLGNDSDVDGDPLTSAVATGPAHGTLALNGDGSFTYTPARDYNGADSFTYTASDGKGGTTPGTVTITVTAVNDVPVVSGETYATDEDTRLVVAAPGVLANDVDVDGDALAAAPLVGPAHGTLTLRTDGSFDYVPVLDYNGSDTFTYRVQDGKGGAATGTTTLLVRPVNDSPVLASHTFATREDEVLNIGPPGVLGSANDADGDPLTAALAGGPAHGTLALAPDGSFTYTPALDFNGSDAFTYTASDGNGGATSGTATINVAPVNDAPVASGDAWTIDEDTSLVRAAPGVLGNDTDVDGDVLTATLLSGPPHGTLSLGANGGFIYTPVTNFNGIDFFTYQVSDGNGGSATATTTLTVRAVNDAPVAAADNYTTNEDVVLVVAGPGVLGNDTDVDGDALLAALASGPTHGTLALAANGGFTYTPAADYNGVDAFTYTASDGNGGTASGTVTISIAAVNDAPVAAADAYSVDEDQTLAVAAPGVMGNDTDVDGDVLRVAPGSGPAHGTLVLDPSGSFTYVPAADYNGTDTFTYILVDDAGGTSTGTVAITVRPVNDAPVAANDSYRTDEDTRLAVAFPGILGNDTDVDGDALTAALATPPAHGSLQLDSDGGFVYTPDPEWSGTDGFGYVVADGNGGRSNGTVSIRVDPVNDAPVAAADNYTTNEDVVLAVAPPGVLVNDHDVDGDALTANLMAPPAHGAVVVAADGGFTYTPAPDFNGTDAFTYGASDGNGGTATGTVTIAVAPMQDFPVAVDDVLTVDEDTALVLAAPGILANDFDVDGDALTARVVDPPTHGSLALLPDGSLTYVPVPDFNGRDSFTYAVDDGHGGSSAATVTVAVAAVNDAPVASADAWVTAEDTALDVVAPGVLANDGDIDGDAIAAVLVVPPAHGTIELRPDGSFHYAPAADFHGVDFFVYAADDGHGGTQAATVVITVTSVNDAPLAIGDAYEVDEDTVLTVEAPGVLQNDVDVDGDRLTVRPAAPPSHGTLVLGADGAFVYTPAPNFAGADQFTYTVEDGNGGAAAGTVTITVLAVNDAPLAVDDLYVVDEDEVLARAAPGILENDVDVDGDVLTATLTRGTKHGTLELQSDGGFVYTPDADYFGADTFTYVASDGHGGSSAGAVAITVAPVNDAPVPADDAYAVEEDGTLDVEAPGVLANDTDVEGDILTAAVAAGPTHGVLRLGADGDFTYTPARDFFGVDRFTYVASDENGGASVGAVAIQVTAVNDAPVAVSDTFVVRAGDVLVLDSPGILSNDFDVDGDSLRVIPGTLPSFGTLELGVRGAITYTPPPGFTGVELFTYRVTDGTLESGEVAVLFRVEGRGVTFRDTVRGGGSQVAQVTTGTPLAAVDGDLYLAAISTHPFRTAAAVSGMDLVWRRVRAQCGGRGETGVEIWMARGKPRRDVVTASLEAPAAQAVIVVSRYAGVDAHDPIGGVVSGNTDGQDGECTGGGTSAAYSFGITTLTQGGIVFGAVAMREREHLAGNGYFERVQTARGTGQATAGLAIADGAVDAGDHVLAGSFDTAVDWALVGVEIRSNVVPDDARRFANALRTYPNPFNATVSIEYMLYRRARVVIRVHDARGALVRTLQDAMAPPGRRTMQWDARNDRGLPVASGIYFVRVEMEDRRFVRKISLVK